MQLNFVVMPAGRKRASRGFLDSPVKPENDKNVSLLIAVLVTAIHLIISCAYYFSLSITENREVQNSFL